MSPRCLTILPSTFRNNLRKYKPIILHSNLARNAGDYMIRAHYSSISFQKITFGQERQIRYDKNKGKITKFHSSSYLSDVVRFKYVYSDGEEFEVDAEEGRNLLDVAQDNDIELEGACGGELACATCHLIFEKGIYDTLPEKDPEEDDMLDLAFELTDTSRLGCQICVSKKFDGMKVRIPDNDF